MRFPTASPQPRSAAARFSCNFVAIVPLAAILGASTECLAAHTGQMPLGFRAVPKVCRASRLFGTFHSSVHLSSNASNLVNGRIQKNMKKNSKHSKSLPVLQLLVNPRISLRLHASKSLARKAMVIGTKDPRIG